MMDDDEMTDWVTKTCNKYGLKLTTEGSAMSGRHVKLNKSYYKALKYMQTPDGFKKSYVHIIMYVCISGLYYVWEGSGQNKFNSAKHMTILKCFVLFYSKYGSTDFCGSVCVYFSRMNKKK